MPLQLRRGTNAERQLITPQEGELIYVTDYEIRNVSSMWVGDGFTPGGNPVDSNAGTISLSSLTDVDVTSVSPQIGDVLKWNGAFFTPQPDIDTQGETYIDITSVSPQFGDVLKWDGAFFTPQVVDGVVSGSNYRINIIGDDSSVIVNSQTSTITGNFVGSLFSDDSSLIIDTATNDIFANTITLNSKVVADQIQTTGNFVITQTLTEALSTTVNVVSNNEGSVIRLTRNTNLDITESPVAYGSLYFERDDANGPLTTCVIAGGQEGIFLASDNTGVLPESSTVILSGITGNFGIGTYTPSEKLTVVGNAKVSGFVQFGSITTTERDALVSQNGMVIYNLTDNKFQGYQNGAWINLDDGTPA